MSGPTNTFCTSGVHLQNGSHATIGGNGAVSIGVTFFCSVCGTSTPFRIGSGSPSSPTYDAVCSDYGGRNAIRILNPCTQANSSSAWCQWFDNPAVPYMQDMRWYAGTEVLADGTSSWAATSTGACPTPVLSTRVEARRRHTSFTSAVALPRS